MQLRRLAPAFAHHDVTWVTVRPEYRHDLDPAERLLVVPDATRWNRLRLVRLAVRMVWIVVRTRPHVVISTGAAPGYLAIRLGRLLGARTVWVDSIANCEQLSLSGQRVGGHVDLWLTQWPHLARPDGPRYEGAVL
ncbi:MAG: UDP-N-acetylglucosamine--LPS N-acetylglucosamine transferase [Deltaproteobacteria bacterium]|nr:MAG: UDP-N-acetylglucosamine--LPS N-acetylglucosamine transferase [Deltaproteobacteria bacterium]